MERRHGYMRQIHSKWTTKSPLSTAGRELECHSYFQHHYHIHCSSLEVKSRHTALCPVRKSFILLGFYYLFQNTPQSVHFQNNTQSHCTLADYFSGRQIRLRLLWKCVHVCGVPAQALCTGTKPSEDQVPRAESPSCAHSGHLLTGLKSNI